MQENHIAILKPTISINFEMSFKCLTEQAYLIELSIILNQPLHINVLFLKVKKIANPFIQTAQIYLLYISL